MSDDIRNIYYIIDEMRFATVWSFLRHRDDQNGISPPADHDNATE